MAWVSREREGGVVFSSRNGGGTYIYDKMHQREGPSIMLLLLLRVPRKAKPGLPFIIPMMVAVVVVVISVVFWVETVDQELE
jgi:hypothetical protein